MPEPRAQVRVAHLVPGFLADGAPSARCGQVLAITRGLAPHPRAAFAQTILTAGPAAGGFTHDGLPVIVLANDNPSPRPESAIPGSLWQALRRFDVVHVHEALCGFGGFGAVVTKSLGLKLVLTDHGGGRNTVMTTGRGLALADAVVSLSDAAAALVAAYVHGPHLVIDPAHGTRLADLYAGLAGRGG